MGVYILVIVLFTFDKLTHDSPNVCGCLTRNEMRIKLAFLIISWNNENLTNSSSASLPELKKKNGTDNTNNNFVYLSRNFHLLEI